MNVYKIKPHIPKYSFYLYSQAIDENNKRAQSNALFILQSQ